MPKLSINTEDFVNRANKVHKGKYLYERSEYKGRHSKLIVTCTIHGDFEQVAGSHLNGRGCAKCSGRIKLTTEDFINNSKKIHKGKYHYDKVEYRNASRKVTITCPEHGDFDQTPNSHTQGHGCPSCGAFATGASQSLGLDGFVRKACSVHDGKYRYDKVEYRNVIGKVVITCPIHGDFMQEANSHLNGCGCPSCAKSGYDPSKIGYVYFLMSDNGFVKIGVTNNPQRRYAKLKRKTPFPFVQIAEIPTDGTIAPKLEKMCHSCLVSAGFEGFEGSTEWFENNEEILFKLIDSCSAFTVYS